MKYFVEVLDGLITGDVDRDRLGDYSARNLEVTIRVDGKPRILKVVNEDDVAEFSEKLIRAYEISKAERPGHQDDYYESFRDEK